MIENKNILAIQCSNTQGEQYALFCDDKGIYHGNPTDGFSLLAILENIQHLDRPIKIYYHFPYLCITERYGLNAATINILDKRVMYFAREDYHSDVSSYSVGFLERSGHVLLVHQTQWNRLDITDLETGELFTKRDIVHPDKNDIDYFHSLLQISPDYKHFLSNGWIWQPADNIMCFETERFFNEYEICGDSIGYYRGYAWDRPCTFVGNDLLLIAADKDTITCEEGVNEAQLKEPPAYHQLLFYKLSEIKSHQYTYDGYEGYDTLSLAYSDKADCDVFTFDESGEITSGELHFNSETNHLIALSPKGAFELTLDGQIVCSAPEIKLNTSNWEMRYDDARSAKPIDWIQNWQYDTVRHFFYRYNKNKIEKRHISTVGV